MDELENLSPAERFARAKKQRSNPELDAFAAELNFPMDDFQRESCGALANGRGVLVAAPTGAGKTIVGEFAIYLAVLNNTKVFYTTPIKALSNQKFSELVKRYGQEKVGLLTGDTNINGNAQIVVMTTEVLRNMIYANSDALKNLSHVIMDEVHYLADRFRGAVWEEVILHLPKDVIVVSLSATVSNAEEFGAWLDEVRGSTTVVVSEHRPVPLNQHVLFGDELIDLFDPTNPNRVNPELTQRHANKLRQPVGKPMRGRRGHDNQWQRQQNRIPKINKPELIELLEESKLLPAIFFIFSRAACEASVQECLRYNIRLTTTEEKNEIRALVEHRCREIADEDLATLGYFDWLSALERGVAAHHAGMLPAFKEVVEELFLKKLVKVVFATETLALGINMPARTVVLDRLDKFNGQSRVQITPGEYTQLTGRAGRRGIDVEGHSVVQWSANLDPQQVAGLASRRTYPLISSFKPTYNMTVNLIEAFGQYRAREVLEMSFAQFQADRSVVGLAKGLRDREVSLAGYAKSMECHLGNFHDYASMRREISDLERELAAGRVRHERGKDIRQSKGRHERERRLADLKRGIKTHPCHSCNEREAHARWGERWFQLRRETDNLMAQIEGRTNQVAKTFDRICQLLVEMDYLRQVDQDYAVTEVGRKLARIYGERDLLVAESLRRELWKDCDPATLAAIATALVYESRRDDEDLSPKIPRGPFADSMAATNDLWDEIEYLAKGHKLPSTSEPDISLCFAMHRWASGVALDKTLAESNLLPGDFIRLTKQVIDLLDQVAQCAEGSVASNAKDAIERVKRGIVAYSYFD